MKIMKKVIAIALTALMLMALVIPSNAMIWKSEVNNTASFIASEDAEIVVNAGRIPSGTISFGTNDEDWKYAYPITYKKGITAGSYPSDLDATLYLAFNGTYLYIKEVRRNGLSTDASTQYTFLMDNKELSTNKQSRTHVGAQAKVVFEVDGSGNPSVKSSYCNRLSYAWLDNNTNNTLVAGDYTGTSAGTVSAVVSKVGDDYVIETAIKWSDIGLTGGNGPTNDVRFGFKYRPKTEGGDTYAQITSLANVGGVHAAGAKTYHNDWDNFVPLYTRAANAKASTYEIDYSWYDASKNEFELTTVGQLRGLAALVNQQNSIDAAKAITAGKTFKLGAEMDLNPGWDTASTVAPLFYWIPIGAFAGTLDGQGHAISNMICNPNWNITKMNGGKNYNSWERNMGLVAHGFGNITIKNLALTDSKVHSNFCSAGLISIVFDTAATVNISNVYVDADVSADVRTKNGQYGYGNANSYIGILIGRGMSSAANWATVDGAVLTGSLDLVKRKDQGSIGSGPVWGTSASSSATISNVLVKLDKNQAYGYTINTSTLEEGTSPSNESYRTKLIANSGTWTETNTVSVKPDGSLDMVSGATMNCPSSYPDSWIAIDDSGMKVPAGVAMIMSRNVWVQETAAKDGVFTIRVLTIVDKQWDAFGVKVEISENGGAYTDVTEAVAVDENYYKSVVSGGKTKTAAEYGGEYIGCAKYAGVSANGTVNVRITPIKYIGSTAYESASAVVTYVNGVAQ